MAISGVSGFMLVNGVAKTADKWSADIKTNIVDRQNYTTGGVPINAAGQGTGDITMEGPYEGPLNITNGTIYTFFLGINTLGSVGLSVQGRVSSVQFSNDSNDGPRFRVQAAQYGPATPAIL